MAGAQVDPKELRQLANDIRRFEQDIDQRVRQMRNSLKRLHWNDPVRHRFERDFDQMCNTVMNSCRNSAPKLSSTLNSKASQAEAYLG